MKYQTARAPSGQGGLDEAALSHSSPWKNKLSYHETPVATPTPLHISPPSLHLFFFSLSPSPIFIHCSFLWSFPVFLHQPFFINLCLSLCFCGSCCTFQVTKETAQYQAYRPSDITSVHLVTVVFFRRIKAAGNYTTIDVTFLPVSVCYKYDFHQTWMEDVSQPRLRFFFSLSLNEKWFPACQKQTLWDYSTPSQTISFWRIGNETQKSTFLTIRTMNIERCSKGILDTFMNFSGINARFWWRSQAYLGGCYQYNYNIRLCLSTSVAVFPISVILFAVVFCIFLCCE